MGVTMNATLLKRR